MKPEELKVLEDEIAAKRVAREDISDAIKKAKQDARALSADIRRLEDSLPKGKVLRGLRMKISPAVVRLKPKL